MLRPMEWKNGAIEMIDQTLLPAELKIIRIETREALWEAIKKLRVRGAPAIGIAAAYGVALEAHRYAGNDPQECLRRVEETCAYLATSRPTAVNLFWALDRMKKLASSLKESPLALLRDKLLDEARAIHEEDIEMGRRIGHHGAQLLNDGDTVLTHCNAGALATGGYGTALGVIYAAQELGKSLRVFADETRPLLQGSRLTAWELLQNGIDVTLICDSMAASLLRERKVHAILVGADRICANGDFANKIGTYSLAVLAKAHAVPFYTAAPWSTIDLSLHSGQEIPIEFREGAEVRVSLGGALTAPAHVPVHNPAFDVTPAHLLSGIITERGVAWPPLEESLLRMSKQTS